MQLDQIADRAATIELSRGQRDYERHHSESASLEASAGDVFSFADDFSRLSSHMGASSMMMMGGSMQTSFDEGRGRAVGSRVHMTGRVLGLDLSLEEVVLARESPRHKEWETVGTPRLLIVGGYRLGFDVTPTGKSSNLRVFIDYDLPPSWPLRGLGYLFGAVYARWCVRQMVEGARANFDRSVNG